MTERVGLEVDTLPVLLDPDRKMCRVAAPPERDFTTNAVV
jgi:hypothetical protein